MGVFIMEYTKDVILQVNYGQGVKNKNKVWSIFNKLGENISKHKMITTIVSITLMLMILDFMLISSFVQVLSTI